MELHVDNIVTDNNQQNCKIAQITIFTGPCCLTDERTCTINSHGSYQHLIHSVVIQTLNHGALQTTVHSFEKKISRTDFVVAQRVKC